MAQTVLITGANRGIGLEFARQFRDRGDLVLGTARKPLEASELRALGVDVLGLDVADSASIAGLGSELGARPIDILINNAGVSSKSSTLESCTQADLMRVLTINSIGPVLVTRAVLAGLRAGRRRAIINITSVLGSITQAEGGSYGYRASKAALNMFTVSMSKELKDFICIALHPGWVKTDMGGDKAPLSGKEAVASMMKVIDALGAADSGRYLNFDGTTLPW